MARKFRCFFSYYGSKARIAHLYPPPIHQKLIEPFCGAANYAVQHFEKEVVLRDLNEDVIDVWLWLQQASPGDILSLPKIHQGYDIRNNSSLSAAERKFMGFWANLGASKPRNIFSKYSVGALKANHAPEKESDYFEATKIAISENLHRIRHWSVELGDCQDIQNETATWFVDPPYQKGGEGYAHNNIDRVSLKQWLYERKGRVILCENSSSDWIETARLAEYYGARKTTTETVAWWDA